MKTRSIEIHKITHTANDVKKNRGKNMGYAVQYKSTKSQERSKRARAAAKGQRTKEIKNAIRWNLPQLEHDTVSAETVTRDRVIRTLRLDRIHPVTDPTGDHTMQSLSPVTGRYERVNGVRCFRRDDLITALKAYVGA